MIRYFIIFVALFALFSCNESEKIQKQDSQIRILATTTPVRDIAVHIAGDLAQVDVLMTAGADPHLFKASENDLNKINNADVILYNGLHLEGRLEEIFNKMEGKTKIFNVSKSIPHDKLIHASHNHDDGHNHSHHSHDPHFWLDVNLYKIAAEKFADFMSKYDMENSEKYVSNYVNFSEKLSKLDKYIKSRIDSIPEQNRYLITAHNAYNYFSVAYNIESIGIQGVSTSHQAGASNISSLADFIAENKIPAVFYETGISGKSVEALKEAVKSRYTADDNEKRFKTETLINPGSYEGDYLDMMINNIDKIYTALKK